MLFFYLRFLTDRQCRYFLQLAAPMTHVGYFDDANHVKPLFEGRSRRIEGP